MLADGLIQANQSIVEFIIKGAFIYDDVSNLMLKYLRQFDVKLEYHQCRKLNFTVDIGELGWRDWDSTCFNIKLYIVKEAFRLCPREYYYPYLRIFSIHGKVDYVNPLI